MPNDTHKYNGPKRGQCQPTKEYGISGKEQLGLTLNPSDSCITNPTGTSSRMGAIIIPRKDQKHLKSSQIERQCLTV